jgi:hypothetical protein
MPKKSKTQKQVTDEILNLLENVDTKIKQLDHFTTNKLIRIEDKIDGMQSKIKHAENKPKQPLEDFSEHWLKEQILKGKIKVKKWNE